MLRKAWELILVLLIGIAIITIINALLIKKDTVNIKTNKITIEYIYEGKDLQEKLKQMGPNVLGVATILTTNEGTLCRVYAPKPKNEHDKQALAVLGHEMLHCFAGQYHE